MCIQGNFIYYLFILFIINFSQKDRGHTKGEPVLGAPPYTHTITRTKYKKTISHYIYTYTHT